MIQHTTDAAALLELPQPPSRAAALAPEPETGLLQTDGQQHDDGALAGHLGGQQSEGRSYGAGLSGVEDHGFLQAKKSPHWAGRCVDVKKQN